MKKIRNALFLILVVLMLLPLAACGASNTPSPVPESTPTAPPADQPVPADITPDPAAEAIDAQLVLLFTDMGRWNQDVSGQAWQYTVTDLDRNVIMLFRKLNQWKEGFGFLQIKLIILQFR